MAPRAPDASAPLQGGRCFLRTAACAAGGEAPLPPSPPLLPGAAAGAAATPTVTAGAAAAALNPAATLAALTLRVPGLQHLETRAHAEAVAALAGAAGSLRTSLNTAGGLAEESSPRASSSTYSAPRGRAGGAGDATARGSDGPSRCEEEGDAGATSDEDEADGALKALRDPGAGLTARLAAFEAARLGADAALAAALRRRRAAGGAAAFARSFSALGTAMRPRAGRLSAPAALDAQRWRLEAERLRLQDALAACTRARWYARLLQLAADGGRGGITRGEAAVLERVKRGIEARA